MDVADRLEIEGVLALYGHLVDGQAWERFEEVFSEDAVFDATVLQLPRLAPRSGIQEGFASMSHPVAHLTTNLVIDPGATDDRASVRSKFLCPLRGGKVLTGEYHDTVVRTPAGWRISERNVTVLRPREGSL
jgi:hypothetical protein